MARLPLQTNARAGTIALVNGYRTSVSLSLAQVYRARPKLLKVPSWYIDRITEDADAFNVSESQRTVRVALRMVWGRYDAGDAVDQRDRHVDGFYGYVIDNGQDSFGANAEAVSWISVNDNPDWIPEWDAGVDGPFYMTEIVLGGFATT